MHEAVEQAGCIPKRQTLSRMRIKDRKAGSADNRRVVLEINTRRRDLQYYVELDTHTSYSFRVTTTAMCDDTLVPSDTCPIRNIFPPETCPIRHISHQTHLPSDTSPIRHMSHQTLVTSDTCSIRDLSYQIFVSSETCPIRHMFHQTHVSSETCPIRHMSHLTLVPSDTCLTRHMSHQTHVPSDTCLIRHMSHQTHVTSYPCHIRYMSHQRLVPFPPSICSVKRATDNGLQGTIVVHFRMSIPTEQEGYERLSRTIVDVSSTNVHWNIGIKDMK
ncbi:hypothetical protein LSH36_222g02004, partial [Paralvinella palmiformis]